MASMLKEEHEEFNSVEDERDYCEKNDCNLKDRQLIDNEDQSPERYRIIIENQVPTDPFKLPEPCVQSILKYLTGMEVIKIMSVSKYWRDYLNSQTALMNRVMDEIVIITPEQGEVTQQEVDNFCDNSTRRGYKHMKAPFILHWDFVKAINPIELHASTLETLEIMCDSLSHKYFENYILASTKFARIKIGPCIFPKLQKLEITATDWKIIKPHSFPVVTHLKIELSSASYRYRDFKNHLYKYPKLETLHLFESFFFDDENALQIERDPNFPKVQNIYTHQIHKEVLSDHKLCLVKLELQFIFFGGYSWIIQECKVLKSLTIKQIVFNTDGVDPEINSVNNSINVLKIDRFRNITLGLLPNNRLLNSVKSMLLALPSLREFVYFEPIPRQIIPFLASNMAHLKKFACTTFNEQYSLEHALEQVRSRPNQYINSTFEIIVDPECSLFEIEKEFE